MIWTVDGTRTWTTNPGQSGPRSNGDEGVLYLFQTSRIGASLSNAVYPKHSLKGGLISCSDAVGFFYSPSRQSGYIMGDYNC